MRNLFSHFTGIILLFPVVELCSPTGNEGAITTSPTFHLSYSPPLKWTAPVDSQSRIARISKTFEKHDDKGDEENLSKFDRELRVDDASSTFSTETPSTVEETTTEITTPKITTPEITTTTSTETTTILETTTAVASIFPGQSVNLDAANAAAQQAVNDTIAEVIASFNAIQAPPPGMFIDLDEIGGVLANVKQSDWGIFDFRTASGAVTDFCVSTQPPCAVVPRLVGFSPYIVTHDVTVTGGPALSIGQWQTIADRIYNTLTIKHHVFFAEFITVSPSFGSV